MEPPIKDKKIAIIGFGKEGLSAANFLSSENSITIFDEKAKSEVDPKFFEKLKAENKIQFVFGKIWKNQQSFDYVVRSPGVRPDNPQVQKLLQLGGELTSVTRLFFQYCPCEVIGVTGTKGKGTTSSLIHEMLKTQNKDVHLAGNIGTPALEILPHLTEESLVVLELSSFQLFDATISPRVAVVLMITSEHLDWHASDEEYREAKEKIVSFQKEQHYAVINKDFKVSESFATKTKAKTYFFSTKGKTNGLYIENGTIISQIDGHEEIAKVEDIFIPGAHNVQNVLAAVAVGKIYKVPNANIASVLKTFQGLPHRLQLVATSGDVKYYNDSFSTTPETTIAALEAFSEPKILILGGSSKNSDFTQLGQKIHGAKTIKALILIGVEAKRIKEALAKAGGFDGTIIEGPKNMPEIINASRSVATAGDSVILSPACASFDMFKNYQDRGEQFVKEVKKLVE